MPAARRAASSRRAGSGSGPTPSRAVRAAQKNWSAKNGTANDGTPARTAVAVVPAPPWWTTAAQRGNSQSWGTSPTTWRSSPSASSPAQPAATMPRRPALRRASTTIALVRRGSRGRMLPKPTNTGGGPSSRNAASLGSGSQSRRTRRVQYPHSRASGGQSAGRGTRLGLKP